MLGLSSQLFLSFLLVAKSSALFGQFDEDRYLQNFDSIQAASYAVVDDPDANLPPDLLSVCKDKGNNPPVREVVVQADSIGLINSSAVSIQCSDDSVCVIPFGTTLQVDTSLSVSALIVMGVVEWSDDTQLNPSAFICAGYIAVEGFGKWEMDLQSKDAFVYVKDNGAVHSKLRSRGFGSVALNNGDYPIINIKGRDLARTWSLLSKPLNQGDGRIELMHNAILMGWRVGDRIAVAPTAKLATGQGEEFTITSIEENGTMLLNKVAQYYHQSKFVNAPSGGHPALMSAEVINLSRNIVVTGDDFKHVTCDPTLPEAVPGEETSVMGCRCSSFRQHCTNGLHTAAMHGGTASIQNTRIERCGQRGVEGKYCLHFHKLHDCPTCLFKNNVVENSHQRGIIVHSTHSSVVEGNVLYNVRGAGIYIEDGNEMYNDIKHNVVICPHPFRDSVLSGCTIPGTSNRLADTKDNQSGIFSRANTNSLQGNRVSNAFNGMLFLNDGSGRGDSQNKVCETSAKLGRIEGNTFHSNGRFGTYTLTHNYPKLTDQSILSDGHNIDKSLCSGFDSEGNARGESGAIVNNVDYFNAFVGHYEAGDMQYNGHQSFDNDNLMYWKETKNFANGCSAHITGSNYAKGNLALPDQATFIIEHTQFGDSVSLEANHHCGVGSTGGLCQPQYIFHNVKWTNTDTSKKWIWFQYQNFQSHNANQNHGGIFSLAPPDADAVMNGQTYENSIFPQGFVSLVSSKYTYLLNLPGEPCVLSSTISSEVGRLYDAGILCNVPLRSLKVWTRGLDAWNAPGLQVEFWYKKGGVDSQSVHTCDTMQVIGFHQIGSTSPKQGFSLPVMPGVEHSYRLSLTTGDREVPSDWIVEFSDTVMGNIYSVEHTNLSLNGRSCGSNGLVSSQHDRRFIWSGGEFLKDEAWGNTGACSVRALHNVPTIDCSSFNDGVLQAEECPEKCDFSCDKNTSYCDCGSATCKPRQGFVEESAIDLCAAARCEHGRCTATFLGGSMPVTSYACVCDEGWSGPICQYNPCATSGKTCSGHGKCVALGDTSASCECDQGFSGENCETSCDEVCSGDWPYGCARNLNGIERYGCYGSGCYYLRENEEYSNNSVCTYKDDRQKACICDDQNDCLLTLPCNPDGSCPPSEFSPDSTPCNSVPFGQCQSGICQEPTNPPPTPRSNPTNPPTIDPTHLPTRQPTPVPKPTYCGCPQCTQTVWDTLACDDSLGGCHTCGGRISWVESNNGGNTVEACKLVSEQFDQGPCGPVCNPETCNGTPEPTRSPTPPPTTEPTSQPTNVPTPEPTPVPEPTYCGCPQCTQTVWDTLACDDSLGGCHTCGGRISWVESNNGGNTVEACKLVSEQFDQGPCGPVCNPETCNGTPEPTRSPTPPPTTEPTWEPSHLPTSIPSSAPSAPPSNEPTRKPTFKPTPAPTMNPTPLPTQKPTQMPTAQPTSIPTKLPTQKPSQSPTSRPTTKPTKIPTQKPIKPTKVPTQKPSQLPTSWPTSKPTNVPTPEPTPVPKPTYCGCPQCTQTVWDTLACDDSLGGCHTCGGRISWVESNNGGNTVEACKLVSEQFDQGPCGPVCNPDICNGTPEPTRSPTSPPTPPPSSQPTKVPTPEPTPVPEPTYCGCPQCTQTVWDTLACDDSLGGCHTCGGRISWVESNNGGNTVEACKLVSEQFSSGPCGVCNPLVCNELVLDEPDPTKLICSDEFDIDGKPDPSKWGFDIGDGCDKGLCGWGNNELQYYTSDNAVVANGMLRISAKKESVSGRDYTSARMVTRGKHVFRYGRIRFRARTAGCTARGTWPALWLLPEDWVYGGWPNSGEIDVMEAVGYEENKFHGSVHTGAYNHGIGTEKTGSVTKSELDWHIFEIEWQEDKIKFAVNGEVYFTFAPDNVNDSAKWPFNQDFHLLLNIAVGGNWGGVQGVDAAAFEGAGQYMELDWVRIYSS